MLAQSRGLSPSFSVVRWLGSCANPQPETHTSRPENDGLVPKVPILKCHIIRKEQANIMQITRAVAGSVPKFFRVHSKCDISRGDGLNVSSVTGEGLHELRDAIVARVASVQPRTDCRAVDSLLRRQVSLLDAKRLLLPPICGKSASVVDILCKKDYNYQI